MIVRRGLLAGLCAAGVFLLWHWWSPSATPPASADGVAALLRDRRDNEGYARVTGPRPLRLPEDHAAHPDFRHEWWYVTGQLQTERGRWFGFQATFFRFALSPVAYPTKSDWRTRQALLAHFALTDIEGQTFTGRERRARASHGLAAAATDRPAVWINDWALHQATPNGVWTLDLASADAALSLRLAPDGAPVLQGDRGYSQKSAAAGNASHYYSQPRLSASGSLKFGGATHEVTGLAWLDHEWGTSALGEEQQGWDWFAVHFDDGRSLSFYRLRQRDGATDPHSRGVLIGSDGQAQALGAEAVVMTPLRWWRSPQTGARYPVQWRVQLPAQQLDFELNALVDGQEWTGDLKYWEGAVGTRGPDAPDVLTGRGYLELTGYSP